MTAETAALAGDEAEIRALVEARIRAVQARDAAQATSRHAPDLVLFDVLPPLRYVGAETARERTESWFSTFDGPIDYEVRELVVTAGPSVAFCHYLYRVRGTLAAGPRIGMWVRATLGFSKLDGTWRLTHEHDSVPFDPASGKALLDLQP